MPVISKTNVAYKKELLTDAEYLHIERQAFEKSEFINGRIVAMPARAKITTLFLQIC
jgi:hypothetical protein